MSKFLSWQLWLICLLRLAKALFPAEMVLFVFSLTTFKKLKDSRMMRWLLIFLICDLGVRMIVFFGGVPFTGRYFYPFAITIAIFAAAGIIPLVDFLVFLDEKTLNKKLKHKKFQIFALIVIIIGVSYSIKALLPRNDKPWLQTIPAAIKHIAPPGKTPVIMSNNLDERFGYYAGTDELYIIDPDDDWRMLKRFQTASDSKFKYLDDKRGITNLVDKIKLIGAERVFIIMYLDKNQSTPSDTELQEKLPGIKLFGTFTDRKKRVYKLYTISDKTKDNSEKKK